MWGRDLEACISTNSLVIHVSLMCEGQRCRKSRGSLLGKWSSFLPSSLHPFISAEETVTEVTRQVLMASTL